MSDSEIRATKDGSSTVYSRRFQQHYHNPNGAVAESRHVFFDQPGMLDVMKSQPKVTILEVGFGTGLNFLLALSYMRMCNPEGMLCFESVEAFPLTLDNIPHLAYEQHLENVPEATEMLRHIFENLNPGMNSFRFDMVHLKIWMGTFDTWPVSWNCAHAIFHDPFSPEANPELWTPSVFEKLATHTAHNGILATYCAASKARAAMAKADWLVARARGALGKREMTLAARKPERLTHVKRVNEQRLIARFFENDSENTG